MQKIENELSLKNMTFMKPWKQITFFLLGFVGLIAIELVAQLLLSLIARGAAPDTYHYESFMESSIASMILNGASYLVLFIIFIILIKDDSSELFKSFKGWRPYVAAAVCLSSILAFNLFYNLILNVTGVLVTDNANESTLNSMVVDFPFASLLIFGIVGPICEELTYRVGLFSFARRINVILAYAITIIVFTLIHFDFNTTSITNELLNIPFYAVAAFGFTLVYEKYGLAGSLTAHVANNMISILATISTIFKV